jgi:DNA-binding response OmpR family regulator
MVVAHGTPEFQGLRVLLVEDDLLIAMEMEDFLREIGCEVIGPFARLDAALAAVSSETFDAAIIDLNLRGELSFPLIGALRARQIPLVLCSGYVDLPEMRSQLEGIPTLSKPFNRKLLLGLMRTEFLRQERSALSG